MSKNSNTEGFLAQAKALIMENISDEQFGVSELAEATNMSRSNLLRKIKKETGLSASQYIRQVRLAKAEELLQETELTISEISYEVGFGNTSYFTKCFREQYGYPPGELRKNPTDTVIKETPSETLDKNQSKDSFIKTHRNKIIIAVSVLIIIAISLFVRNTANETPTVSNVKKSIAILPFKNMSNDATNFYFVNGLMESSLNNLQKIEDLRVISRTSVEKYRNTTKTIAEIAEELNVNYIVEGSGQKINDEVLLNIQLIDVENDTPIWSAQYNHELVDIFSLQNTVAKKIAMSIKATVTPDELAQIDKKPTENLEAYDNYLRGLELLQNRTKENLLNAISFFEKAISHDSKFASAYAKIALAYFYIDIYQVEKQYTNQINESADKALLYDSKSDQSLIAKALYYINNREFNLAIPHLDKALEYNPNSTPVILILSDLYARAIPNTEKYLKYALKGIELNIQANDSVGKSYIYLHLSNALIQTGFAKEASQYINQSLAYNPNNPFAPYLKIFIDYANEKDIGKSTTGLINEWKKDTLRTDLLQEIGKLYYFQENYEESYTYYEKYNALRTDEKVDIYPQENLKMAIVYDKMGYKEESKKFYDLFLKYCENDTSIYKSASLATKYIYEGKLDEAIAQYKIFATKNNFQYWIVLFIEDDPIMKDIKTHPEYKETMQKIRDKFWENHAQVKKTLNDSGLL